MALEKPVISGALTGDLGPEKAVKTANRGTAVVFEETNQKEAEVSTKPFVHLNIACFTVL